MLLLSARVRSSWYHPAFISMLSNCVGAKTHTPKPNGDIDPVDNVPELEVVLKANGKARALSRRLFRAVDMRSTRSLTPSKPFIAAGMASFSSECKTLKSLSCRFKDSFSVATVQHLRNSNGLPVFRHLMRPNRTDTSPGTRPSRHGSYEPTQTKARQLSCV